MKIGQDATRIPAGIIKNPLFVRGDIGGFPSIVEKPVITKSVDDLKIPEGINFDFIKATKNLSPKK